MISSWRSYRDCLQSLSQGFVACLSNGHQCLVENGVWSFFSSPQLENPYEPEQSTLVAAAEFHVNFSHDDLRTNYYDNINFFSCSYASGLFYLHGCGSQRRPLISNPITGRYAILPYLYSYRNLYVFFGFDPIDMQYKALRMAYPWDPNRHKTLTFGDGDMKWRKVKGSLRHEIKSEGICINGVLYYLGYTPNCFNDDHVVTSAWIIVCFDLRSEKITCIDVNRFGKLINYKGKLALIYLGKDSAAINELHMWVLDDVEKHEWSKHAYTLTHDKLFRRHFRIAGATTWGEIVFSMHKYTPNKPFYVFYFNPEKNTLKRVEIKGFGEYSCTVFTFVNHVEDLDVNDLKLLKSTHPPLTEPNYAEECAPDSDSD